VDAQRTELKKGFSKNEDKETSYLAIQAAQDLITKANIDPKMIWIIMATATPDMPVASTGVFVATLQLVLLMLLL
jgi:3-oxoacyl-[acyl-carrier-protein] synthase III